MEGLKEQLVALFNKINPNVTYPFDLLISDFEEFNIYFKFPESLDKRGRKRTMIDQKYIHNIRDKLNLKVLKSGNIKYEFHVDKNIHDNRITGYLKITSEYFKSRDKIMNSYFELLPNEMLGTIIGYLNRLDVTILILDINININMNDNIFKDLISNKGKQLFSILNQIKDDFELKSSFNGRPLGLPSDQNDFSHFDQLKSVGTESQPNKKTLIKLTWTQMYLLFYKVIIFNFDQVKRADFNHPRDAPIYYYLFKRDYNDLGDYLIQVEPIRDDVNTPQFYLTDQKFGFLWNDLYLMMEIKNIPDTITIIQIMVKENERVNIIKMLELTDKYGINYSNTDFDDFRDIIYELKDIEVDKFKENKIKMIKFIYNKTGKNSGMQTLLFPELFKWFRGHDEDSDIKNTYGPSEYYDLQELTEIWENDYEDEPEYIELMDETLKFIASDNPQFDLKAFYRNVNE